MHTFLLLKNLLQTQNLENSPKKEILYVFEKKKTRFTLPLILQIPNPGNSLKEEKRLCGFFIINF